MNSGFIQQQKIQTGAAQQRVCGLQYETYGKIPEQIFNDSEGGDHAKQYETGV